jgi:hypothetical protein
MKLIKSKKGISFLLVIAIAAISAVGAFAYWTTTGSGSGSATVGTDAGLIVTGTTEGLQRPGGPSQTVSFTVANAAEFNQSISNIDLVSVAAYAEVAHTTLIPGCGGLDSSASADFHMANVVVNPNTDGDIAPNVAAQALTASGELSMSNLDENQDDCKNAHLVLTFATT